MFKELRDSLREKFTYYEQDIRDEDVLDLSRHDIPTVIQNSTSFKLYRYMSPEYFNIRNIEPQTIHLSANGDMNDIYEGLVRDYDESDYIKKDISSKDEH